MDAATSIQKGIPFMLEEGVACANGDQKFTVTAGETLIMPAEAPHALHAEKRFKMLLVMIRSE